MLFFENFAKHRVPTELSNELYNSKNTKLEFIDNLLKVNIFVGPNNSGKSKLMRELLKLEPSAFYSTEKWSIVYTILNDFKIQVLSKISEFLGTNNDSEFQINNNRNGSLLNSTVFKTSFQSFLTEKENYLIDEPISYIEQNFVNFLPKLDSSAAYTCIRNFGGQHQTSQSLSSNIVDVFISLKNDASKAIILLNNYRLDYANNKKITKIYIPSIRSLRQFASISKLSQSITNEYRFNEGINVFTGENLPEEVFNLKNAQYKKRQKLIEFEKLISKEFFDSKDVTLTYDSEKKGLLIKIGSETERPIYELGDGLQMLLILTFPFYTYDSGIIGIEEPELFIHPSLQKTFIKFITTNSITENFQIFITTHSNHIIDSIISNNRISLYSIHKKAKENENELESNPDFVIENINFGNENVLNLLGVSKTSVFITNCTIWVEGITDKLYIQKFIESYLNSPNLNEKYKASLDFKEGINYSFVLSGGDSIIHWDFDEHSEYDSENHKIIARKFCSKAMIIVDNDFDKNSKRKKLLTEALGSRFIVLELPEIENYLALDVIIATIKKYESVNKAITDNSLPDIPKEILNITKIGDLIDNHLLKNFESVKKFSAISNTSSSLKSSDKYSFCNHALTEINNENLSKESILLVEKILDFITEKNKPNHI